MEEALTALLAGIASGRRYWTRAPQTISAADGPYLVLNRVDGIRSYGHRGPVDYVASRVQVDCYGATYAAASATARAVIALLSGHRDATFQGIFVADESDTEAADAGEVTHLFRKRIDFFLHHKEI
jgi:hypothetical protein